VNKLRSTYMVYLPRLIFSLSILAGATLLAPQQDVSAASLANWQPGNIIEDAVFTNSNTMNAAAIQSFLNSKVAVCDTNGTAISEFGGGTRAQWAAARGYAPPFTCLKDFSEGGKTSAQIIFDASQEFSINPQVLIVKLQKEQSLVTDTWPIPDSSQYRTATGYGCPDTAACDSQYYGLTNQIRWTARMFRAIINQSPTWFTPYTLGQNFVRFSPDINCGGSTINIQNRATQALYNYTPYQPNPATLAAGWGTAPCGAYGNRNFYHYFVDWFGSTSAVNGSITLGSNLTINKSVGSLVQADVITASYTVSNSLNSPVNVGGLGICGRLNGQWFDFGFNHVNTLGANSTTTVSFARTLTSAGSLELFTCSYNDALGGWASNSYPYNGVGTIRTLSANVGVNPALNNSVVIGAGQDVYAGTSTGATFTVRNTSNREVNLGRLVLAVRDPSGQNRDFPSDASVVIPAGGTYSFNKTRQFLDAGSYTYFLSNRSTSGVWDATQPRSTSSAITRSGSFIVRANPVIISSLSFSPAKPLADENVTASMQIRNNSPTNSVNVGRIVIAARDSSGRNYDFPSQNLVIPAGATVTYSQSRSFDFSGELTYFMVNNFNNAWIGSFPTALNTNIRTSGSLILNPSPSIASYDVAISQIDSSVSRLTASINVRNTGQAAINIGRIVFSTRNAAGANFDLPSSVETMVQPGATVTVSSQRDLPQGTYTVSVVSRYQGAWVFNYPPTVNGLSRTQTVSF